MDKEKLASWLIIIGLAAVFLYAGLDSFLSPDAWIGYFPAFMRGVVSDQLLLGVFSACEIFLALWLLSRRYLFYSGIIAGLTTLGIMIFNLGAFDLVFRDIAIVFAAAALAVLNRAQS